MDFCGVGYLVIPLHDLLQQVEVLITWNTGFFIRYLDTLVRVDVLLQVEVLVVKTTHRNSGVNYIYNYLSTVMLCTWYNLRKCNL